MKKYNLKNILTAESRNGFSMSSTLTINDKPVCRMNDIGDGSLPSFEIYDQQLFNELNHDIANLPAMFIIQYGCELKIDMGMFIDILHYALATKTEFKLLAA